MVEDKIVYVDIEVGGWHRKAPIIEVAAVAVYAGSYREIDSFDVKIQFDINDPHVDIETLGVNKFSPTVWQRYAIPRDVAAKNFCRFLNRHATDVFHDKDGKSFTVAKLAAHNADFDSTRLKSWCRTNLPRPARRKEPFYPGSYLALCTVQKADWFFRDNQGLVPPKNLKLKTLAEYFGLFHKPDHTALNDVRSAVELARTLAENQRIGVANKAA